VGEGTGAVTAPDRIDVEQLYLMHWHSLVRLALLLVDDVAAAEDVVQDAFVGLHRNQHSLRSPAVGLAYLRTAIVNGSRSALRRRRTARRFLATARLDPAEDADRGLLARDVQAELLNALRALPRRQREVLVLRYWSHLSEAEIARALGVSVGTVKSSASRAMSRLEQSLRSSR
jgi:RNA polymerase sigma-70 factor (sigma-E family)